MANILLGIEHGIEVAAEDILKFVTCAVAVSNKAEPGVIAGLGVLLGTVAKALGDIDGVVANPMNFTLDAATIQDLKAVWPAIVQFAASIGIKL
jgi:NAD(P)H-dependent flavin oxidoreductase YrpB (nitropropane dioxygenase family)